MITYMTVNKTITNMMALVAGQVHEEDDQHHGQSQACGSHILGSRRKGKIYNRKDP